MRLNDIRTEMSSGNSNGQGLDLTGEPSNLSSAELCTEKSCKEGLAFVTSDGEGCSEAMVFNGTVCYDPETVSWAWEFDDLC